MNNLYEPNPQPKTYGEAFRLILKLTGDVAVSLFVLAGGAANAVLLVQGWQWAFQVIGG